ncbi:MAG: DUF2855 family protein [Chitinophagales bacterium]
MPHLLIHKTKLNKIQQSPDSKPELQEGEILFKVEKYALTSNNITYAVCGFSVKYWNFFPSTEEDLGIIPVWGFAEVVESKHSGIAVGERCYGYFPMADYLKISVGKMSEFGFSDVVEHRRALSPIYNYYSRLAADPSFDETLADYIPIIKPLFATSFLIYHFLKESNFFDSEQIVLTSASSKTALALASMLKQNQAADGKKIIGLTSTRNIDFVKSTGYYDSVMNYEESTSSLAHTSTAIVDFAGNTTLLQSLNDVLGDDLKNITLVGLTDWQSSKSFKEVPKSAFFFAPTHIQNKYKEWGAEKTNYLLNKALMGFVKDIQPMLELEYVTDRDALAALYLEMLGGKVNPKKGYLVTI